MGLKLENVTKSYSEKIVVDNISLEIITRIILCNILLCISSIKFNNYRKNIKDNRNISNINKTFNDSTWKNNRNWNNRLTSSISNHSCCFNF